MARPRPFHPRFFLIRLIEKSENYFLGVIRCVDFEKNIENILKNLGHVISPFLVEKWSKFRFKPPCGGVPLYLWPPSVFSIPNLNPTPNPYKYHRHILYIKRKNGHFTLKNGQKYRYHVTEVFSDNLNTFFVI